jgi:DNA-directed RNA polymerase II subunit RPB9
MATPQSTTSADGDSKKQEQITFRFCSECSNMLYPKEDPDARKLQFTCRTCQYTEEAQSTCVFRNFLNTSAGETAGVTQDVGSDPTVSDCHLSPVMCLGCGVTIACDTCGDPSGDMVVSMKARSEENLGMCQFKLPWGNEDPFDEYDEERLEEDDNDHQTSQSTMRNRSDSDSTSDAFSDNSMTVDL